MSASAHTIAAPRPGVAKPTDCVGILMLRIQASGRYTLRAEGQQDVLIKGIEQVLAQLKGERAGALGIMLDVGEIKT